MFISILQWLLFIFLVFLSLFLILIVLLQRGKGGGLVGAFGGMGGSSMFGTKTTDVFLRITIWTAVVWFVCCFAGRYVIGLKSRDSLVDRATVNPIATTPAESANDSAAGAVPTLPEAPATEAPATEAPASDAPASDAPAAPADSSSNE